MVLMNNWEKEKKNPQLKEKHKERRIKKIIMNKIKDNEWQLEVKNYKNND